MNNNDEHAVRNPAPRAARRKTFQAVGVKNWIMPCTLYATLAAIALVGMFFAINANAADIPNGIAVTGAKIIAQVHAEGLQIYECKDDGGGKISWQFREPLATLITNDKTVGRHFAGPGWEFADGSRIKGKVAAQSPGASKVDIPLLQLQVIEHEGEGELSAVDTVQRLNTKGGAFSGACDTAGSFHLEPYSADYVFLHR